MLNSKPVKTQASNVDNTEFLSSKDDAEDSDFEEN